MRRFACLALLAATAQPVLAADVAYCKMSPDRKSVSVIMSNPYSAPMQCEVNCNMTMPGGFGTVVCSKLVPVGTNEQVMCTEDPGEGHVYSAIKASEINCPDPAASPKPTAAKDSKESNDSGDDDDAAIDAEMKKMQDNAMRLLKQLKKQ